MSALLSTKLSFIDEELAYHDAELSNHMKYYGSFSTGYIDPEAGTHNRMLSNFLIANLLSDMMIDKGSMFRFNDYVTLSDSADEGSNVVEMLSNDYIVFNNDVIVFDA